MYVDVTGQTPVEAWNNLSPAGTLPLDRLPQAARDHGLSLLVTIWLTVIS